jgi:tryptophan 2,3-dioxygenase
MPAADKSVTYGSYLKVPELLSLQQLMSSPREHDEPLFIIIHQVYELWFKLMLHEVDSAANHLRAGRVAEGTRLLRRVVEIQRVLIQQIRVLETMRPQDFLAFRYHLNPASGFQSVQFRELECALGMPDPKILDHLRCAPDERQRLADRLEAPGLNGVFDAVLKERGFDLASEDARRESYRALYANADDHPDRNALAEVLMDIDEALALWRFHHVQMVERMIGAKPGTGGSEGVAYLATTLKKRAFPDLWLARTGLQRA